MSAKAIAWNLQVNKNNDPLSTLVNIVTVLQKDPMFSPDRLYYDEFKDRFIVVNSAAREMRGDDITHVRHYLQDKIGLKSVTKADVKDAIEMVAWQRKRHCARELVQSVVWDDEPRLDTWLMTYLGAVVSKAQPLDYLLAAGRNCLLSMVARIVSPGCQVDTMMVLEGPQGGGKTSALRVLGGDYYRVALESMTQKDFLQALRGAWLIEIAELSATSKADVERVKVIVSTPSDPYRPSYGAYTLTYPRQCIFIGTTNRDDYLLDETGGRRFHPVRCGVIDLAALARDRMQLLAEAWVRVARGEAWHLMPTTTTTVQATRRVEDVWQRTVLDYLRGKEDVTIAEVLIHGIKCRESDMSEADSRRMGRILRGIGWGRRTIRRQDKPTQGYKPIDAPEDDIEEQ